MNFIQVHALIWSFLFFPLSLSFSSVYICINLLSDIWLTNILSYFVGYLFTLNILVHTFKNIYEVQFIYFLFCCFCLWCHIKEIIAKSSVMKICPLFPFKNFIVLDTLFRPLIHFELIFAYNVRRVQLFSFACVHSVFPAPFIRKAVLSPLNSLCTLVKNLTIYVFNSWQLDSI